MTGIKQERGFVLYGKRKIIDRCFVSIYAPKKELAEFLSKESKEHYFVSMPDTRGNIDASAHLWGTA